MVSLTYQPLNEMRSQEARKSTDKENLVGFQMFGAARDTEKINLMNPAMQPPISPLLLTHLKNKHTLDLGK